jgi:hypothetical protein
MVNSETWFKSVTVTGRATRSAADPLNLRLQACRLETRRNFFSQRVVDTWNNIPATLKQAVTVKEFKNGYRYKNHRATMAGGTYMNGARPDSSADNNHGRTFSERCYLRHGESTDKARDPPFTLMRILI